ncbi:9887_t:CDS:2 [Funneliformis geosporum]|uniref:3930_t:CDS:1 n=1 Tax=Funneliformis geosporum TaxID=1117311 RepID=A0A9W4ST21_9GLOM|nr:9887_t:CDS:2 [Funneliformis geosporum]CAI2179521.1 3930_t:CDS:2 [Funneliformis geosporum]
MGKLEDGPKLFHLVSKEMPSYTPEQLSNYWNDYLDPECENFLTIDEKRFIINMAPYYNKSAAIRDKVCWKELRNDLRMKYGHLHPIKRIRNVWYNRKKRYYRAARTAKKIAKTASDTSDPPSINQNVSSRISIASLLNP